jgi:hypothetical protein
VRIRRSHILPAVTFLAGLLLGGAVMYVAQAPIGEHAPYVLESDLDLGANYAFDGRPPVRGTLIAGSKLTGMLKGSVAYISVDTVIDRRVFESVARRLD